MLSCTCVARVRFIILNHCPVQAPASTHDLFERKPKEVPLFVFFNPTVCAFSYCSVSEAQEEGPWYMYSISRFKYFEKHPISLKKLVNSPKFNHNQKALYHHYPKIL